MEGGDLSVPDPIEHERGTTGPATPTHLQGEGDHGFDVTTLDGHLDVHPQGLPG